MNTDIVRSIANPLLAAAASVLTTYNIVSAPGATSVTDAAARGVEDVLSAPSGNTTVLVVKIVVNVVLVAVAVGIAWKDHRDEVAYAKTQKDAAEAAASAQGNP